MESIAAWCAERGLTIQPYGIDLAPGLVELARRRLPHWADRIWLGNAIDAQAHSVADNMATRRCSGVRSGTPVRSISHIK